MNKTVVAIALLAAAGPVLAEEITHRKDIRPLWEDRCERCHGSASPYLGTFEENKKMFEDDDKGPRMDSYADLLFFVAWPDTGALMRRLDDGKNTKDGQPGNMYKQLGKTEEQRQAIEGSGLYCCKSAHRRNCIARIGVQPRRCGSRLRGVQPAGVPRT